MGKNKNGFYAQIGFKGKDFYLVVSFYFFWLFNGLEKMAN